MLNRVYASVANRNWKDNICVLDLLGRLEEQGVRCINSRACTEADYYKYRSAQMMIKSGVPTPVSALLEQMSDYVAQEDTISQWGFPLVIKRNMGGRAFDICRATSERELRARLEQVFSREYLDDYAGGIIVQPYLRSIRSYDIRIQIVAGEYVYGLSRSLVSMRPGEEPWLGSSQWGSKMSLYHPSEQEIAIAKHATLAIGAVVNEVDLLETEEGYSVIENNPTPSFRENSVYLNKLCDALINASV